MTRIAASPRTPSRRGTTRRTAATGVEAELQRALATLGAGSARTRAAAPAQPTGPVMGVGQVPNPAYLAYENATGGLRGTGGMSGWGKDASWRGNPYPETTQGAVSLGYPSAVTPSGAGGGGGGGATGNPFLDAANRAEEAARVANEERYVNMLTEGRNRQEGIMGLIGQQGQSQTAEINRLFNNRLGTIQQDLVSRGLAADPSLVMASDRERQRALLELQDRLLTQRIGTQERLSGDVLGLMERRNDAYPDIGPLLQMAQQYNQAGQSSQALPGTMLGGAPINAMTGQPNAPGNPLGFQGPGFATAQPTAQRQQSMTPVQYLANLQAMQGIQRLMSPAAQAVPAAARPMPAANPFVRTTAIQPGTTPWEGNLDDLLIAPPGPEPQPVSPGPLGSAGSFNLPGLSSPYNGVDRLLPESLLQMPFPYSLSPGAAVEPQAVNVRRSAPSGLGTVTAPPYNPPGVLQSVAGAIPAVALWRLLRNQGLF